jgi:prolyl-tRNA editing enzyme YbaK/EbsC (Cys-tRNA(Pro) deacylase)
MVNTAYNPEFASQFYPKYIAVIIQWATKLNSDKMNKVMQGWQNRNCGEKVSRKGFSFRSLDAEKCLEFTGYSFNAVTPVLFNRPMPVLVSEGIGGLEPKCFFMGGGNVDTKLRIGYDEFVEKSEYPIVKGDIANLRTDLEGEGAGAGETEN